MASTILQVKYYVLMILIFMLGTSSAYADEPIMITLSTHMNNVVFDGKWSFTEEWKASSLNNFFYDDGTEIELRSAHQDNFIYIMIDDLTDTNYQKRSDYAMICFDKNDAKPQESTSNDYCFVNVLNGTESYTLQGGSTLGFNGNFKKITNFDGLVAIGNVSDKHDRYSLDPHSSYEFRIPLDKLGRLDHYGFYMAVFESHTGKIYTYPKDISSKNTFEIPPPKLWGDLISPDQSLPEFPWPLLILSVTISSLIVIIRLKKSEIYCKY
ncbi:MAG: hypothetical protein KGH89_00775 [Thaumarchaeota archaeon]|nr:hypothetical protein [Nitrososphaerota archaeon]